MSVGGRACLARGCTRLLHFVPGRLDLGQRRFDLPPYLGRAPLRRCELGPRVVALAHRGLGARNRLGSGSIEIGARALVRLGLLAPRLVVGRLRFGGALRRRQIALQRGHFLRQFGARVALFADCGVARGRVYPLLFELAPRVLDITRASSRRLLLGRQRCVRPFELAIAGRRRRPLRVDRLARFGQLAARTRTTLALGLERRLCLFQLAPQGGRVGALGREQPHRLGARRLSAILRLDLGFERGARCRCVCLRGGDAGKLEYQFLERRARIGVRQRILELGESSIERGAELVELPAGGVGHEPAARTSRHLGSGGNGVGFTHRACPRAIIVFVSGAERHNAGRTRRCDRRSPSGGELGSRATRDVDHCAPARGEREGTAPPRPRRAAAGRGTAAGLRVCTAGRDAAASPYNATRDGAAARHDAGAGRDSAANLYAAANLCARSAATAATCGGAGREGS